MGGFLRVGEPCNGSTSSELQVSISKEIAAPDPFTMKIQQGKKTRVLGSSSTRKWPDVRFSIFVLTLDFLPALMIESYRGSTSAPLAPVLQSIDLDVPENQFVCLLGASGCGKTTMLRIIAGLTAADSGRVEVANNLVAEPGKYCSLVFQNYGLLPWRTVLANVEFSLEIRHVSKAERRAVSSKFIERVGLAGSENLYPHEISGGMQQRVALARAYCKNPKVLLMDEPFAAVDMQTRERLQDELLEIWATMKTTVLFVTHSIEEAIYLGDRVIVMGSRPGRINADVLIDLPRPRAEGNVKSSQRFGELRQIIRDALSMKLAEAA
jgi:NitT/TauT family transport system ATP-binding protein